jgi:carboxyl-terminal processing protease
MPSRPQRRGSRIAAQIAAALLLLVLGIWLGGHPSWLPNGLQNALTDNSQGRLVNQVLNTLRQDYYRPVNPNQLLNKGLGGIVASLNDPYSRYYDPAAYRAFLQQSNPHLSGVGIDVVPNPKGLLVVDVFPGAPAAKAGLRHGDVIVGVGGVKLAGHTADYDSTLIRGPAGTRVSLTVTRGHRQLSFSIVRARVAVPVASGEIVKYHGIAIGSLRLTTFSSGSGAELRSDVAKVLRQHARALILDLRENGGGLLDEAVNVSSIFIPDGTIVSTRGRSQPTQVYTAKGNAIAPRIPMVVLVDRNTASASEIVTGALKDRGRAEVVGTRTYGKGVFQEILPTSNGGALDITVGEYFTPNGQNLGGGGVREGRGIKPNVYAADKPASPGDHALTVAEQTVTAHLR